MRETGQFIFGLEYQGKTYYDYSVRPLSIGGELAAIDELDQLGQSGDATDARSTITTTLAYWVRQLTVPGIPTEAMSIRFLLDNLASEDYQAILDSIDALRVKSPAAGHKNTKTLEESQLSGPAID